MLSTADKRVLREQLGREPRGVVDVSSRCPVGHPAVIRTRPLLLQEGDFEIFPTLFWLTCPSLVQQVSAVEAKGYIQRLERELKERVGLWEEYSNQIEQYRSERWNLLSAEEKTFVRGHGLEKEFIKGIGGIRDPHHLKCLHLHVAHHLTRENVVGRLVVQRFKIRKCPKDSLT